MSTQIHPTAIVDSSINMGVEVRVGPYAVIEAGCVIGDYCEVRAHAVICKGTLMGPRNQIGYGAIIGAEPQDYGYKGGRSWVEIGSGNKIREYVTIHRASKEESATSIGNDNFLMGGVHVGHDAEIGNRAILANNSLLSGYVKVEDGAFLGGATIVHQHTRIGRLAITRGGTRLGKDVPPFFMATDTNLVSGINRVGLRRAGFSQETRRAIQAAFELLYRSNLNVSQALEELGNKFHLPEIAQLTEFVRASKRGICRADGGSRTEEEE
ncbi:MAG TPA: acyl-ACP--UDP-N-acetylglucosamine O-acyltransferase [Candidatus Methylacidiphilales bacterium]|jgi:UDP-N-acetylglucosamine acyltransferase|nr:acyl-ACP--UDP-N-acetylglucosamine O-acyltransferase [Candidatus Methylacidiphilales bacterium]